jgi:hypothetical protein
LLLQFDLATQRKRISLIASLEMFQCQSPSYYELFLKANQSFVSGFQLLLFSNKTMIQLDSPTCDESGFYQVRNSWFQKGFEMTLFMYFFFINMIRQTGEQLPNDRSSTLLTSVGCAGVITAVGALIMFVLSLSNCQTECV